MRRLALIAVTGLLSLSTVAGAQTAPTLELDPPSGGAGASITATVDGFLPGTVEIHLDVVDTSPVASEFIGPDGDDGFSERFTIPRSLDPGPHTVIACLNRDRSRCEQQAAAKLTVIAPTPPTTTSTSTTSTSTTTTTSTTSTSTTTTSTPTGVVTTTTAGPSDVGVTTLAPTTTLPTGLAPPTTLGGDPVPPPSSGPVQLGATTTSTQPSEGAFPSEVGDIDLVAIEITQGLQNLDNEFPLVQGRPTWVRLHAITHGASGSQANADAAILVLRNGVEQGILWAENGPLTLPGEMSSAGRRTNEGTPYFEIPYDWTTDGGTLEVRAMVFAHGDVDAGNEADPDNNAGSATVFLSEADPATIHYFPLYLEDDAGEPLIHWPAMGLLHEHLHTYRTWPIGQLTAVAHHTVVGDASSDWDLSEKDSSSGPNVALAEIFAESGLDSTHQYAGMVHADVETHFGGFASSGTTWSRMGRGYDGGVYAWRNISGEVVAHEGGHWAGLLHAPCEWNGEPLPAEVHGGAFDQTFPATYSWPECSLAPTDWAGYFGFDPMPSAPGTDEPAIMSNNPAAPNAAYPFMGYVAPGWTDPYHGCTMLIFLGVACDTGAVTPTDPTQGNGGAVPTPATGGVPAFDCDVGLPGEDVDFCSLQLGPSGDPTALPPAGPQQLIVGMVDTVGGQFRIDRAVELATHDDVAGRLTGNPAAEGPYVLALVDEADTVQWATTIDIDDPQAHGSTEESPTPFVVRFPTFDDTARIILARPGEVLAEMTPTAPPDVRITEAAVVDDALAVEIDVVDADSEDLRTSVQYRPGDDAPWVVLAAGSSATSFRFDGLADLPSSDDGEVLVRVSDGFSTATDSRTGVVVADQPPTVTMLAPVPGATFTTTDAVTLIAHGIDADAGGDIDALDYRWESSVDGHLGAGRTLVARDLGAGDHTITVVVTDVGGNESRAWVSLTVVAESPADPELTDAVAAHLRGPIEPLGPVGGALGPGLPTGDGAGCGACLPLALGTLSALLLIVLTWRWNRPGAEAAPTS